jgi:hypothetical protein
MPFQIIKNNQIMAGVKYVSISGLLYSFPAGGLDFFKKKSLIAEVLLDTSAPPKESQAQRSGTCGGSVAGSTNVLS